MVTSPVAIFSLHKITSLKYAILDLQKTFIKQTIIRKHLMVLYQLNGLQLNVSETEYFLHNLMFGHLVIFIIWLFVMERLTKTKPGHENESIVYQHSQMNLQIFLPFTFISNLISIVIRFEYEDYFPYLKIRALLFWFARQIAIRLGSSVLLIGWT